ncbi:rhodanese-like domain-containing protein [Bacillus horti]|uniref:Rhodanese-related sulfurtransferase n=1 Tax=Caldalkalibacillus horti TaxID=77523 RepID=A0ABT9VWS4_9BACI|nr:rhodanese-like domain-containing protein [Bacillus horti]MDQ0165445.1 rhodanese-related sulfurtransferase [Bacillus horti]
MAFEKDGVKQLSYEEVLKAYKAKDENVVLLDVRELAEYEEGHIPGIQLLPTSEFVERYEDELDKTKEYIIVCRSGNRSQNVCRYLQEQGFESLANYDGGMLVWEGPTENS